MLDKSEEIRDRTRGKHSISTLSNFRVSPGIVFVFSPESFSRSSRNPLRVAPDSTTSQVRSQDRLNTLRI
jgi:hypothetical protein